MVENVANRIAPPADGLVVDVTSDLICPWCFVAKRRLEKASSILGKTLEVRWHPFQLNPEMPVEGLDRRLYRSAKFGSWEQSQRLDAQVSAAGTELGIRFRHDLMKRTPNTFKGHVLLAAALKDYPDETPALWVQEEPENMGAWPYLRRRFGEWLLGRYPLEPIARPASASPAAGSKRQHEAEQQELIRRAL